MNELLSQLIPVLVALAVNECTEISPWLARRILRTAARRLGDQEAAARYEEEWLSLLEERPGKILKLFFATWIALRATWTLRTIHRHRQGTETSDRGSWLIHRHPSSITVPAGYEVAPGVSSWTVHAIRTPTRRLHLGLAFGLWAPAGAYLITTSHGWMPSINPQVDWFLENACLTSLGGSLLATVSMILSRTLTLTLMSEDGRSITLNHVPLRTSGHRREALTLAARTRPWFRASRLRFQARVVLNIDIVPLASHPADSGGELTRSWPITLGQTPQRSA
ncbi:hypothetical protein [Streptomyces katsurahamanus]|uniref:Uncharacterized protein n=1 Tax=Streptomyces katsurahamanus TaxID=2577098 RepID=A0ABW9NUH7_9ACTN|nr:hypothetical protein [Streptomyces katsurahamanus]MQS36809.1 hypothetical protein [Streptomyces katsurahamanus]